VFLFFAMPSFHLSKAKIGTPENFAGREFFLVTARSAR
jgi:hypothetical protein